MAEMENKEINIEEVSINTAPETDASEAAPHPTVTGADTVQTADCGTQVDSLISEVRELNDKYMRAVAELENTRRRAALDCESTARRRKPRRLCANRNCKDRICGTTAKSAVS